MQAGLALGAPAAFPDLKLDDIMQMNNTNINGMMFATHAVLNASFMKQKAGTVLNITSTTALEAPPFPGEAVYHANKACQEGFTNALRNELQGTNIRVLALRPGVVATHFHHQRVGYDEKKYKEFTQGFTPLEADQVAEQAVWMLQQPLNVSVKALDVVPSGKMSVPLSYPSLTSPSPTIPDRVRSHLEREKLKFCVGWLGGLRGDCDCCILQGVRASLRPTSRLHPEI
jgi:3-hydroxy acid dehydrogenase/malonic semialdehyde reductase